MNKIGHKPPRGWVGRYAVNPNISPTAKAIYACLAFHAGNSGCCYPKVETICVEVGISRNTFYRHIEELITAGAITKTERKKAGKHTSNMYNINL